MAKAKKPRTPKKPPKHIPPVRDYEAERKRAQRASGTTPRRRRPAKAPVPDVAAMTAPVSGTSVAMSGTAPAPPAAVPDTPPKVPDLPPPVRDVVPRPPLIRQWLAGSVESAEGFALFWTMVLGDWIIEVGTWEYLLGTGTVYGVAYGKAMAASIIAGEMGIGRQVVKRWRTGQWDSWTWCLVGILLCFAALQSGVAYLRETAAVHRDVAQASQTGASMQVASCPHETMPDTYIRHPQSIDSWQAGANARYAACLADQRAQRREHTGTLVANAKDRNQWEVPVLIGAAAILSVALSVCATATSDFAHSLVGIQPATAPVPAKVPPAPEPLRLPAPAPATREGWLRWLAHWPGRWLARRRQPVPKAA